MNQCDKKDNALWYATRNKDGKPTQQDEDKERLNGRLRTYELIKGIYHDLMN